MMNIIILSGIIYSKPKREKIKKDEYGVTFTLCTWDNFCSNNGEKTLNLFKCMARGEALISYIKAHCLKGRTILVRGSLHSCKYIIHNSDDTFTEKNITEIVVASIELTSNRPFYNFNKLPLVEKRMLKTRKRELLSKRHEIQVSQVYDLLKREESDKYIESQAEREEYEEDYENDRDEETQDDSI